MVFRRIARAVVTATILMASSAAVSAQDWAVEKTSGLVWIASQTAQPVALDRAAKLSSGDLIQTGPNGRVLLTRGQERVLIAPNSVVSLPDKPSDNGMTTILQRAGSIAVEAEKKDHQHFEVQTPYLAAVVKGTQFTVTVANGTADVQVSAGKVEVSDLRSGKVVLVLPGQAVHSTPSGFTTRGNGPHEPVHQGSPRAASVAPVIVPRNGLRTAPTGLGNFAKVAAVKVASINASHTGVHISQPIGAVKLDALAATSGLVRNDGTGGGSANSASTVWNDAKGSNGNGPSAANGTPSSNAGGNGNAGTNGNANGVGNGNGNGNAFGLVNGGLGAAVNGVAQAKGLARKRN